MRSKDEKLREMVARRMCQIREAHNHTQEYLTNNTRLKIWEYESKRKFPSLESIATFCKFYDLSLDEFFSGMTYPKK
ncbi:hypothetical protein BN3659_01247 [Alistipes sp. CHKCI003]|nr:hypothetical protein BN3659_01247 [Alistipes sp. CHKCI003]